MVTTLQIRLPRGKKFAACFTYDVDALSWPLYTKRTSPSILSQAEFSVVGAERILDLLDQYSVKASFYIPGHTAETFPDLAKEIHRKGHEIGHHGYLHEAPRELSESQERRVLRRGSKILEKVTGTRTLGYRAPAWDLSPNSVDILLEEEFVYDSSMMAHDYRPYLLRTGDAIAGDGPYRFGKDTKLIELPVSWSLDDAPHFDFDLSSLGSGLKASAGVLENWMSDFDFMRAHVPGGLFSICFHPETSGRGHRMVIMEKLLRYVIEQPDVWVTRMLDVAKAVSANSA
jgi:peptidoglycan-N-acetylglucosamine deacetylase